MGSPFDKIATTKTATTKTAKKIEASVTKKIKDTVDRIVNTKAFLKAESAQLAINEALIIAHVKPQQQEQAEKGNYSKSFSVAGNKHNLTYTTQDKFSIANNAEVHEAIQTMLGDKFEDIIKIKRTKTFKSEVTKDEKLLNNIVKALKKAGIKIEDVFEATDSFTTVKNLDKTQYEMGKKHKDFSTYIKQYKPSLK